MSNFSMEVGSAEIVALSDMNFPFPMPLNELWPKVSPSAWKPYRDRYPDTFDANRMLIEIGCYLVRLARGEISSGQDGIAGTGDRSQGILLSHEVSCDHR